jgi:AcrR family transcriptional regulator
MDKQKANYHHGNLYQSLISSAGDMIQDQGIDSLSMRKLADYVGVSRTAPYHHFKDKNQLLCAIAETGFKLQDEFVSAGALYKEHHANNEGARSIGLKELERLVQSYIQFAITHPAHYDLMYGGKIWKQKLATESLEIASRQSFKHWLDRIEEFQTRHILSQQESTLRLAQVAWATLHGLCRLTNDGVYIDNDDVMEMGKSAARMMLSNASDS